MAQITDIINDLIQETKVDTNLISDGYHTFGELYDHRIALYISLCRLFALVAKMNISPNPIWKSKTHHDDTSWDGWFIMGLGIAKGQQISYHLPLKYWDQCDFADTLEKAPEWDGHTPADVIERLLNI